MDLNQMLVFAKVVEHQSFTKAARDLGMEKSTVSNKIAQLEERLGARLLNRTTRFVSPTEAGKGYYLYCSRIVENAEEADRFAESLNEDPQGTLRVTAPADFNTVLAGGLVGEFLEEYPGVRFELFLTNRMVDLVKERFDLALRIGTGNLQDSSLIARHLFSLKTGLYAAPSYLKKNPPPRTLEELEQHHFVVMAPEQQFDRPVIVSVKQKNKERQITIKGAFKVNDMRACKESVLYGSGISLLSSIQIHKEVRSGRLVPLLEDLEFPKAKMHAIYPSRQWIPAKLRAFLQHLENWVPKILGE